MGKNRRDFLKVGLGVGSLFLPLPYAWVWAQSEGAVKLMKAPKVALVIGNGKYKDAPELKNPPNDAKAIGEVLKGTGFAVTMKLDTGREEMLAAIRDYVHLMEQKKHVGLFYFAGHGVQLAWRNYLLPVDAVIDKIDDVAKQSVDIARLIEGLTKASNPMNVIILDACRENPFGSLKNADHKGLSQMDAPNQTLLAYATSPGNVASDGDGVNGLYTENLLREIKVPEAKIEDVFKRVRLGVRRKSNGAQIPWESTSLEEDFWFLPPKELKKISEEEAERRFKEEQALWEKAQAAMHQKSTDAERERKKIDEAARQEKLKAGEAQRLAEIERERLQKEEAERLAKLKAAELQRLENAERERQAADAAALQKKLKEAEQKRLGEAERARIVKEENERQAKLKAAAEQRRAEAEREAAALLKKQEEAEQQRRAEAERARRSREETAQREVAKESAAVLAMEEYMRRYPSGNFSELAQLQFDRALAREGEKKALIASAEGNPFTKGSATADTAYKVGDSYGYRIIDNFTKIETAEDLIVTQIGDSEVNFSNGFVTDLLGNPLKYPGGMQVAPAQFYPLDYAVGKHWHTRAETYNSRMGIGVLRFNNKIVTRERITVPAGTFDAFRVEVGGTILYGRTTVSVTGTYWMSPQVRREIAAEERQTAAATRFGRTLRYDRRELVSFKQG